MYGYQSPQMQRSSSYSFYVYRTLLELGLPNIATPSYQSDCSIISFGCRGGDFYQIEVPFSPWRPLTLIVGSSFVEDLELTTHNFKSLNDLITFIMEST